MELWNLLADDDAVSPVIGVVLMVGITVALASVIGIFVLGVDTTTTVPDAEVRYDSEPGPTDDWGNDAGESVHIEHDGGAAVDLEHVTVEYAGAPVSSLSWMTVTEPSGSEWEPGEEYVLEDPTPGGGGDFASDQQLLVLWHSGDGTSQILANGDLP